MSLTLGNSGAPRWYNVDRERFTMYLEHLQRCGANATEIVLHDGDADGYTSRVHVLRPDWDYIITGYRDVGMLLYFHGSLTPAFAVARWQEDPDKLLALYDPLLRTASDVAIDQGGTNFVVHASGDPNLEQGTNERISAEFAGAICNRLARWPGDVRVAIELRTVKETRPTAAANSRASVRRIVGQIDSPMAGICWDVAHDYENAFAAGVAWTRPDDEFLEETIHLHVHDIGVDGEPHCPPIDGPVPLERAIPAVPGRPVIMEVRWRMAERAGEPWQVLAESYRSVRERVGEADAHRE